MKKQAGFTMLEIMVCIVILIIISSLILPALTQARSASKMAQCTNNLHQLGQALVMYQSFEGRNTNGFPERLTHLADPAHQYVADYRLFLCPMDSSKGTSSGLKPGKAFEDKADWAERASSPPLYDGDTRSQQNCSYLYEFSSRTDGANDWARAFLVSWVQEPVYDDFGQPIPNETISTPEPLTDTDAQNILTWQDAKFWQKTNGDICNTCIGQPGNDYPDTWFARYDADGQANGGTRLDPFDMSFGFNPGDGTTMYSAPQHGYSGSWLPIVRCFWHQTPAFVDNENYEEVLNLAMDGNTFLSAPGWEQAAWNQGRDGDAP